MDSLLHNRSICRKNGSPFLSLMGISHTHTASVCLLQDKRKIGWFKHKEKHLANHSSNNAEQNQNRFQQQWTLELGIGENFPTSHVRTPEMNARGVFWRWVQGDLLGRFKYLLVSDWRKGLDLQVHVFWKTLFFLSIPYCFPLF